MTRAIYTPGTGAEETEKYFDSLAIQAQQEGLEAVLDSATSSTAAAIPASVGALAATMEMDDSAKHVLDSVVSGIEVYRQRHGVLPTADVIEAAIQQGMSASKNPMQLFDSVGNSNHSDNLSAQANRIVVAVTSALAEAIPFATYLPTDIGSNEAKLGITSHMAGSAFGGYAVNDILDGINVGDPYISSERVLTLSTNGGGATALTGTFKAKTDGSGAAVPVLRYRSMVCVNGKAVGFESSSTPATSANSPFSGVVTISGTEYTISGFVTPATGAVSVTFNANTPANTVIDVVAFVDYETAPSLSPEIITQVTTFSLFATPWRVRARQSIDAQTQYQNEIRMDLSTESLSAIRAQFANERHYNVLRRAKILAAGNTKTFDFALSVQIAQKTRAQIWQDFQAVLGAVDQQMAEDTMDHGITHLYVGKNVAAQWLGLGRDLFEPSGLEARPGIFRLGRLFGKYEVYYSPKIIAEAGAASQILCFGRSQQVARCPFVLGDAVPPTYLPLSFGDDMKSGQGFYARNFTSVNPHAASAAGVALINITNLF